MAYLVLANGTVFEGERIGAPGDRIGELVFNTDVVGYIETLTDPGYYGQIVAQTFPPVGNYGIIEEDFEGRSALFGYIVRELCEAPYNFRSQYTLGEFLLKNGIPGLMGPDTRQIVRILREEGTMNAMITDRVPDDLDAIKSFRPTGAVSAVTTKAPYVCAAEGDKAHSVTLVDLGVRKSLIGALCRRHCEVTVVPAGTAAADILASRPDGVVLSNGPGDPRELAYVTGEAAALIGRVPVLGIGLGHQVAALALGGSAAPLHHGRHGGNCPVRDARSGMTYITAQNTNYTVDGGSLNGKAKTAFVNVNDGGCEGLYAPGLLTAQFYPDSWPAPRDTGFIFDEFITMMGGSDNAQR